MKYDKWLEDVPLELREDSLWRMEAYRLALFAADIGWHDATKLAQYRRTLGLSDQLYRSLGSISANIAEGYSRGTGNDRARFYEYALGSARESRDWQFKARYILGENVTQHRLRLLAQTIRLLLVSITQQRNKPIREEIASYTLNDMDHVSIIDTTEILSCEVPFTT